MQEEAIKKRIQKAIELFESGYNCAQAVVLAYSDCYGVSEKTAAALSSSFGGGMGRLREVCGAVSGMFIILGLHHQNDSHNNKTAKDRNYTAVQQTADEFKTQMGSIICADLLKIKHQPETPVSDERNAIYYALRPCTRCVAFAAEILGKEISR